MPDSRKTVPLLDELAALRSASHRLIDALVASGLLLKTTRDGDVVVEIAVDSLLQQWDGLAGRLQDERTTLALS